LSVAEVSETLLAESVVAEDPPVATAAWDVWPLPELEDPVEDGVLELDDEEAEPVAELALLPADDELVDAGQESAWSDFSCAFAFARFCWSVVNCCRSDCSVSCDWERFALSWASCELLPPASASARFCWAAVSAALAEVRFCWACVALIVASCSPLVTLSPTATLTAVSMPLVEKLSDVVEAELTLAEAVSVDWIVPRATVAVRVTAAGVALLANTASRPKPTASPITTTIPA